MIKTPTARFTLNKNTARLNAAVGDKVISVGTCGHAVIDPIEQDTGRRHRFITGTLLDPASKQQIKLWTPEGNRVYPLVAHEAKTTPLPEGTMVAVEINEAGAVIDVIRRD